MTYASQTVSTREAAAILGVSVPTIHRMVDEGTLAVLPNMRHRRITKHSIEETLGHPLQVA